MNVCLLSAFAEISAGTRAAVKPTGSEVQLPARWQLSIVTAVFDCNCSQAVPAQSEHFIGRHNDCFLIGQRFVGSE
jgi:hypothetical protein